MISPTANHYSTSQYQTYSSNIHPAPVQLLLFSLVEDKQRHLLKELLLPIRSRLLDINHNKMHSAIKLQDLWEEILETQDLLPLIQQLFL